ncbi:hypothetical protein [Paenibacillus arenosi]|uniref:Uncharacterized protein n=1 Tax=Paenibacillus arenosi TaxID=2774142 RepID=A0ABR9AWL9_9BACL|nr:hypothetical protein [Paenibacillus arenosi]MBD8498523.1 hypothetical protein [Paenibacillus arenosi]
MKLQIEQWVEKTHPFEEIGLDLFKESVSCYKIGAYRSAFLMSYLALMQTIRYRILNFTTKPQFVEERNWNNYRSALDSDRSWEEAVFNVLSISKPKFNKASKSFEVDKRVIKLSNHDEIIADLLSWRYKRNRCAHAKVGTINSSTVECFWSFIQDNIFKFHVNGGLEYYKEAIYKAYRDQYEKVHVTYKEHLDALPTAELTKEELIELWGELESKIDSLNSTKKESLTLFWSTILLHSDSMIKSSFVDFVNDNSIRFIRFYSLTPELLPMVMQQVDAHLFKKEKLYLWIKKKFHYVEEDFFWKLVVDILKNYTPKEDLEDFFSFINLSKIRVLPNEEETKILKENSFFASVEEWLCSRLRYSYDEVPSHLSDIHCTLYVLENITLNSKIVSFLNAYMENLQSKHYPMTNDLYYKFKYFIRFNKEFSGRLRMFVNENQIELCRALIENLDNQEE